VTQVLTAAYKKTAAAKSAKVRMTMPATMDGGGNMEMTGTMEWDPTVMDMAMKGSALQADPDSRTRSHDVAEQCHGHEYGSQGVQGHGRQVLDEARSRAAAKASGGKALQK
jgi:hypothetical protein